MSDEGRASIGQIDSRSMEMNLSMDCKKMLIPRARRNTPLKKAPRRRALCQPNDSSAGERDRSDIWAPGELKRTAQLCPGTHNDSYESDNEADQIIHLGQVSYLHRSGRATSLAVSRSGMHRQEARVSAS